MLEVTKMSNFI